MMGSPDLRARRVIDHTMVRPDLLIIYLFLIIHTQAETTSILASPSGSRVRPCTPYERCPITSLPIDDPSTLASGSRIKYDQNLTSENGAFTVGFFVDDRKNNAYLGTWYTTDPKVIVWVANRDNPIPYRVLNNCSLVIADDGNANLFDSSNNLSYWSTASNPPNASLTRLHIRYDGNLKFVDGSDRVRILWQSFDNPTDTFLPGMDIRQYGINLTSWKNPQDPAKGDYMFSKEEGEEPNELLMFNSSSVSPSSTPYWGSRYSSLHPNLIPFLQNNMTGNLTLRLVMNATGSVQLWELIEGAYWSLLWNAPNDQCDFYNPPCPSYGVCDADNSFRCKCLPGYQPNDTERWELEDFSSGCSKKTPDQCGQMFLPMPMIKLPYGKNGVSLKTNNVESETECRNQCLSECGNKAYSFDANQSRCLIWTDDLTHIQEEYYNVNAHMLYIRVNPLDIETGSGTCNPCGTNVLPYPLSNDLNCGDRNYFFFKCNNTNGQLYFNPPGVSTYKVSHVNPDKRKFTVQLVAASVSADYKCNATNDIELYVFNIGYSSPFNVAKCSIVHLISRTVVEVDVSWKPPPSACNSSADCKDSPGTTCASETDGKKFCVCGNGFHWNFQNTTCAKDDDHRHKFLLVKVGIACATGVFLLIAISFVIHLRRRRVTHRADISDQFNDEIKDIDIPFVDYPSILVATNNFSEANKLGAGGFGPVYKGLLADGNEVAVKRLSAVSLQGVQEFRNEILVIAKLQHRNLVRILGYCIKKDEKILIYEYMPNKSLDSFLFNQTVSPLLDWTKRFNIILGIARGLLYLHQDSRLRIIHRDLKPSNILLDKELNPKISDFGLAKIVEGNEMAANTARVIGTYGYMSPEYALDGYFSIKSDVYSFGIILFEVISGMRCTRLLQLDSNLVSLLGYAWTLWGEGRELELVDKAIGDTYDSVEVKRCINVAFLCVQENPSDRPTMSSALLMLGGDSVNLPHPKQPVFVARRQPLEKTSSSRKMGTSSNVELTTTLEGR